MPEGSNRSGTDEKKVPFPATTRNLLKKGRITKSKIPHKYNIRKRPESNFRGVSYYNNFAKSSIA